MTPTDSYTLADKGDYRFLQKLAPDDDGFTWPTVVCRREGKVIGFAASNPHKSQLVLGRAWVDPSLRAPGVILMRLMEAYDRVALSLRQSRYTIVVEGGDRVEQLIEKLSLGERYAERGKYHYYNRALVARKEEAA